MNTIITIGRQYGSGGKEIGKKLAEWIRHLRGIWQVFHSSFFFLHRTPFG